MNVKQWLAQQFTALDTVRSCTIDREADVVVYMWAGTIVQVHLLDTSVKTRHLRKVINENTRIGVGTLFLVNAALVPNDGEKLEPGEGLLALHALFKDKIYTYRIEADVPRIGQVHFKTFGRGAEREVWYGPDIQIHGLPSYRMWVKAPNSVKGEWLMANFSSESFWKQADYTTERDAFRRQQRQVNSETHYASWSNADWNENSRGGYTTPENGAPRFTRPGLGSDQKLSRSYTLLGLRLGATSEEVKAAFRKMARELHPDVSKLPKDEAENRFKNINEAYTYIKTTHGW